METGKERVGQTNYEKTISHILLLWPLYSFIVIPANHDLLSLLCQPYEFILQLDDWYLCPDFRFHFSLVLYDNAAF